MAMSCFLLVAGLFLISCVHDSRAQIKQGCMQCICKVEGCESQIGKCRMDVGSLSCGPYQIKKPYWIDCGSPGGDYQTCAKQMACSVTCVREYTRRYGTYCTGGRTPTCEDYSRIHNGGPKGCQHSSTKGYWQKVKRCCDTTPGVCMAPSSEWMQIKSKVPTDSQNDVLKFEFKPERDGDSEYPGV